MQIQVNKADGKVFLPDSHLARDNDNLIQTFDVTFNDTFIDGIGQLDFVLPSGTKGYINMEKNNQVYSTPIYNSICKEGTLTLQFLVFLNARFIPTSDTDINPNHTYYIKEGETYTEVQEPVKEDLGEYYVESVPLYHSKSFTLKIDPSINATLEENEEYPTKIALINAKLKEVEDAIDDCEAATEGAENVNISSTRVSDGIEVTTTDRTGTPTTTKVNDGADGKDAKINGYNTITIVEGTNIGIEQEDNTLTINNTYDDSTILSDITDLQNDKADKSEIPTKTSQLTNDSGYATETQVNNAVGEETTNRQIADNNLQTQIDAITSASDVVDVVSTYQDLLDYDTYKLTDKDVIKVMQDSTHSNAISYYRWVSNTWEYIGSEGPFYTKGETDTLLNAKQNLIDNSHKLSASLVSGLSSVATSGSYNDLSNKPDLSVYEEKSNKITSFTSPTNTQYPSAKLVSDSLALKEDKSNKITTIDENSTDTQYPSAKCVYDSQQSQDTQITQLQADYDRAMSIYNVLPKVNGTGENISLDNTGVAPLNMELKGNTYQETTSISGGDEYDSPSPDHPQPIQVVSGDNSVVVCGKNLFGKDTLIVKTIDNKNRYGYKLPKANANFYFSKLIDDGKIYSIMEDINGTLTQITNLSTTPTQITNSNNDFYLLCFSTSSQSVAQEYYANNSFMMSYENVPYEPYQSTTYPISLGNLELCKIGTYQDKFFKAINGNTIYDNLDSTIKNTLDYGEWYLEKNIGKVVLDGSEDESWTYSNNIFGLSYVLQKYVGTTITSICDNFMGGLNKQTRETYYNANNNNTIGFSPSSIFLRDDSITSAEDFKTWLSTHNTEVYYVLATPTYTKIEGTLASQLEDIKYALSKKTQTNISQINNGLPMIITAETLRDISEWSE